MVEDMIVVDGLRKVFPRKVKTDTKGKLRRFIPGRRGAAELFIAVDGVSFNIRRGEVFGLLGPNGAGKTTTIRMLSTLLEPTSGTAIINGYDVTRQTAGVRQSLGAVLTGERSIYWKLTGRENLEYFASLNHIPRKVAKARINELLERMELANRADEYVERYSSGMKQRVGIAKALLANPPVLLLDEPTIGLDPQSARNLRELVLEIRNEGHTVLLTTHYMEEADLLCDRVGIIDSGKIIALDTPNALKRSIQQTDIMNLEVESFDPALRESLAELPQVENVVCHQAEDSESWSVALHTKDTRTVLPSLIEVIGSKSAKITNLQVSEPTLEDVFITHTGKQLRD